MVAGEGGIQAEVGHRRRIDLPGSSRDPPNGGEGGGGVYHYIACHMKNLVEESVEERGWVYGFKGSKRVRWVGAKKEKIPAGDCQGRKKK